MSRETLCIICLRVYVHSSLAQGYGYNNLYLSSTNWMIKIDIAFRSILNYQMYLCYLKHSLQLYFPELYSFVDLLVKSQTSFITIYRHVVLWVPTLCNNPVLKSVVALILLYWPLTVVFVSKRPDIPLQHKLPLTIDNTQHQ